MKPTPVRIQLSRKRGFNLQEVSKAINGLPAKRVARPSLWGNEYKVGRDGEAAECVQKFRDRWAMWKSDTHVLRGMNLACWCARGEPCHADVLLEMANA